MASASLTRLTCLSLALSLASPLGAQDAHYWTVQYGPRASLLGGAVIGAVGDVSAAFYNPGGLALVDSLGFAFSINVLEHRSTTAQGGVRRSSAPGRSCQANTVCGSWWMSSVR